jgi:hypothetical protein
MATRTTVSTAQEYAQSLVPHLEHESYRCDEPHAGLMGKGCRPCGVEVLISIADFRSSGNLEAFEKEMKPHAKKGKK